MNFSDVIEDILTALAKCTAEEGSADFVFNQPANKDNAYYFRGLRPLSSFSKRACETVRDLVVLLSNYFSWTPHIHKILEGAITMGPLEKNFALCHFKDDENALLSSTHGKS